jgi:Peptidase family M1 domain
MLKAHSLGIALLVACTAMSAAAKPVVHHDTHISFDIDAHIVTIHDLMTLPADSCALQLGPLSFTTMSEYPFFITGTDTVSEGLASVKIRAIARPPGNRFDMRYTAEAYESTDDVVFSRENVGREIQATISDEGIYLAASSYWLASMDGAMATHRLTIETPSGWEPVTQGRRVFYEDDGETLTTIWDAVHPSDGLTLVAGPYHVTEEDFDGVTAYTYFLEDDERLVKTYMERTGAYLEMYQEMIGPYPYAKFATVENWFPTGYGMPSYTLLGGTVLRLPFIPFTSFGHEIAHNWWGNSAFVDETGGNWCEGITVYCADYHYKELESPAAAREYRRNLLKDYAAYVTEDKDMPLAEFKSRHSGATRAIGYGKSMMVFHMIDRMLGRDAFLAALREVWTTHPFSEVSWTDFMTAFARHGDRDLEIFQSQWLQRKGAPLLHLDQAESDGEDIRFTLSQDEPIWQLQVPVVLQTPEGAVEHVVSLERNRADFSFPIKDVTSLAVDPDCHVFRRLHPQEIEATLSMVFGDDDPAFVIPDGMAGMTGRKFAETYIEEGEPRYVAAADDEAHSRILINPDPARLKTLLPDGVTVTAGLVFIEGRRYSLKDHQVVMAVSRPGDAIVADLVVLGRSADHVAALGGRIVHYGKYSWLVFAAKGRPERGNWPTDDSPLVKSF